MEAYCIRIVGHEGSESQAQRCLDSAPIPVELFDATTPDTLGDVVYENGNKFSASCATSHFRLWQRCLEINEPIMILEHDAMFTDEYSQEDIDYIVNSGFDAVSLYWPGGHKVYNATTDGEYIRGCEKGVLAKGYILMPHGAKKLIDWTNANYLRRNDDWRWGEIKQGGYYKEIIDDTISLATNLRTSNGEKP